MPARRLILGFLAIAASATAIAPSAPARDLYVANYASDSMTVIDGATNQVVGAPVPTGAESGPWMTAITPDGKTVYTVGWDSGNLIGIDTATKQVSGPSVPIGIHAWGIAITPDGTRAYIATGGGTVTAVNLQTRQVIGAPIPVCALPNAVIITPDGTRAYVACADSVPIIDTATNQVVGSVALPAGVQPYSGAVTPDGKSVFVTDRKGSVVVIDTATNQATQIPAGGVELQGLAITPDGKRAYAPDYKTNLIMVIDVATRQVVNPAVTGPGFLEPEFIAASPDGTKVFASQPTANSMVGVQTAANQPFGPIGTGLEPGGPAFVPDQSPVASLALPAKVRPGVPATLSGAASTDPDGTAANFAWQFGDGGTATGPAPTAAHTYAKPGSYGAVLTVTDNEGCSVAMVFTGQTASCHGSPAATQTQTVQVKYPGVKVKCPKKAGPKGCKFKLKAVKKTGKGKKQKLKALSAVAKVKVKAGKSKIVSLKPKKKFAKKLATAKKALVEQTVTTGGETTTKVGKLKIVE
jgi:YVTN family beta-propeller protein